MGGRIEREEGRTNRCLTFYHTYDNRPTSCVMRRRALLATTGITLATPLGGCLATSPDVGSSDDVITPAAASASAPPDNCGPASQPLSEILVAEVGEQEYCYDSAEPSFTAMNERTAPVTLSVALGEDGHFAERYDLESGERIIERRAFDAAADITGTVTVDGEEWSVRWPDRACYHHAVAVTPDELQIGWLEPIKGPADTQHDCYPGDSASVRVASSGGSHEVTVTIEHLCTETTDTETFELSGEDRESFRGVLMSGGKYDVTVSVADGEEDTYEFHEGCWGVTATIDEAGHITHLGQFGID